jgi:type II secretion system protein J
VNARGFTLLEILIATVLFAMLMGAYYSVFTNVADLESYARDQRAYGSVGPAVMDLLEDDFQSLYSHPRALDAFPFRGTDEDRGGQPADVVNFVAARRSVHQEPYQSEIIRSPINEVGYRLAKPSREDGVRRLYRRENFYVDAAPLDGGDYYELYDRVVGFDLKYVGFRVEEGERTDQDTLGEHRYETFDSWDSVERKYFPTAVVVTLTIRPPRITTEVVDRSEAPETRTFVRIIRLTQADDILPPAPTEGAPNGNGVDPNVPNR